MRNFHYLVLALISVCGLLAGFAARRISPRNPANFETTTGTALENRHAAASAEARPSSASDRLSVIPRQPSNDTLESVLGLDCSESYGRIASWLAGAGEQELAAYWADFSKRKHTGDDDDDVREMIFINWTRLNPGGAMKASHGHYAAWKGWTANDPGAALAAATAAGEEQVYYVAGALGEFHPAWLRAHFDELSEKARDAALATITNRIDSENPRESLDFLKKTEQVPDEETFKALIRKDPWAAADWLKENPRFADDRTAPAGNLTKVLYSTLCEERPEELERLAGRTPPGEERRQMEKALFDHFLKSDPAAALEQARSTEAPLLASQRLGKIGLDLVSTDPAKALEIAGEVLVLNPGNLGFSDQIEFPGGTYGMGGAGNGGELMQALFDKDPAATVEMIAGHGTGEIEISNTLEKYVRQWAVRDLKAVSAWLENSDLTADQKASYRKHLSPSNP